MIKQEYGILIVDSDKSRRIGYKQLLEKTFSGRKIDDCGNGDEALEFIGHVRNPHTVILMDYNLGDMTGLDLCRQLDSRKIQMPRVMMVDERLSGLAAEALEEGIENCIIRDVHGNFKSLIPAVLNKAVKDSINRIILKETTFSRDESEEKFKQAFMLSPDTVFISSLKEGRIIEVNENVLKDFGYSREEILGKQSVDIGIVSTEDRQLLHNLISSQGFYDNLELTLMTAKSEPRTCLLSGHLISIDGEDCIIQTVNDITARQRMEEELLRSKNLETIGILAGGIANDFNQLLTSLMGNISMAKLSLHDVEKIHRTLSRAEEIAVEAAELAGKLMTFSDGGEPFRKENSIINLVQEMLDYNPDLKVPNVKIEFWNRVGIHSIQGDESQLTMLIYNVLLNAIEAIPKTRDGLITVKAENVQIPWENRWALHEGDYVKVRVEDNGEGIPEENMDKIFAPYFTTRDSVTRGGVGLGLSICQSIIRKHYGHIYAESTRGEGAVITMLIPAHNEETPIYGENKHSFLKGSGKILVMDDESYVGEITDRMLRQMGYFVEIVKEGNEALALYKRSLVTGTPYDVVILNLGNKRGMGGEATLEKLRELDPGVKAIASSGYLVDADTDDLTRAGFCATMKKPYSIARLSQLLYKVTVQVKPA